MKPRIVCLFIIWYSSALPLPVHSQGTNPPYVSQFPSIERVKAEIKGTDALDTAARQMGAFWQLKTIVEQLSGFRRYRNQLTPDEARMIGLYAFGRDEAARPYTTFPDKGTVNTKGSFYTYDEGFREELFARFLSPQVRALWAQTEGNTNKTVAASKQAREQKEAREGGLVVNRPVAPAAITTTAVGPADPSIAKATAARVDTTVVGLQLGEPLRLPECNPLGFDSIVDAATDTVTVRVTCVMVGLKLLEGLNVESLLGIEIDRSGVADMRNIRLSRDYCPAWVTDCAGYATVHNGRLSGIALFTAGRGTERTVTNDLREKYGPPTRSVAATITPEVGNDFNINKPEWTLPGLRVEYEVVLKDENGGERVTLTSGVVRIMTESEYQRRAAKQKAAKKRKL